VPFCWNYQSLKVDSSDSLNPIETRNYNVLCERLEWINENETRLSQSPGADKWIIGNYMKMFGLLRINYDDHNWKMLIDQIKSNYKVIQNSSAFQLQFLIQI
jgi:hypothetical protein